MHFKIYLSQCNSKRLLFTLQLPSSLFSAGTQCIVQMPHWLSWASTSNPNPSFNLKNCSLCKPQGTEMRNAWSAHCCCIRLRIDSNISLQFALLHFACLIPLAVPPSTLRFQPPLQPLRPGHHRSSIGHPFFFPHLKWEDVCYGGPVKAVSTGEKAWWGWAEWMSCQAASSVMRNPDFMQAQMRGRYRFLSTLQQKKLPCQNYPQDGCESRRSDSLGKQQGVVRGI